MDRRSGYEMRRRRYLVETPAVPRLVRMSSATQAAKDDLRWSRLCLLLVACLALAAWSLVQSRPAPGIKRAPAQTPTKQLPKQRANPTGEPEPLC